MKWQQGRQGGRYSKLKIWEWKLGKIASDLWIIKYLPYYIMPVHKDEVEGAKHWRLNIVIKGKARFDCQETIWNFKNRIILFRPDLHHHSLMNMHKTRIVLSLGFVKFNK